MQYNAFFTLEVPSRTLRRCKQGDDGGRGGCVTGIAHCSTAQVLMHPCMHRLIKPNAVVGHPAHIDTLWRCKTMSQGSWFRLPQPCNSWSRGQPDSCGCVPDSSCGSNSNSSVGCRSRKGAGRTPDTPTQLAGPAVRAGIAACSCTTVGLCPRQGQG